MQNTERQSQPEFHGEHNVYAYRVCPSYPTELIKKIVHHWQKYFPNPEEWVTTDRLDFEITGYRDGGYRGITRKVNVSEGKWRVNVETIGGLLLGRLDFEIVEVSKRMPLKTIYR